MNFSHKTVLLQETIDGVSPKSGGLYVDCTAGGGGHTALLLKSILGDGRVFAFDRDPYACSHLRQKFDTEIKNQKLTLTQAPFSHLKQHLTDLGVFGRIDGLIADLGVSSPQIDLAERGFSFMNSGPLDMRMSGVGTTAAEVIHHTEESELARIFYELGEEVKSRQIASAIVRARDLRRFETTKQLADFVKSTARWHTDSKKHPATKVFQALRIFVNDELGELGTLVHEAFEALTVGGRLAIITFHSLEDRIVKHEFQKYAGKRLEKDTPKELAAILNENAPPSRAKIIKPFPVIPSEDEIQENPRSRSAKLRVLEKLR
jgi:16S rRNA (cytosine1402-N4)-methyltransferase